MESNVPMDDPAIRALLVEQTLGVAFRRQSKQRSKPPDFTLTPYTSNVLINIHQRDGVVQSLASVSVDAASGELMQATAWKRGMDHLYLLDVDGCALRSIQPPTDPTLEAILTDSIGPLGDPTSAGFSFISETVVERDEGPVIQRISDYGKLDRRTIEMVSTRDGSVHSSISLISLNSVPYEIRPYVDARCPELSQSDFARLLK